MFACSMAVGTALCLAPKTDQTIFSDSFASTTLDTNAWTATGDVSVMSSTESNNSDTLADWTATGATISGETATISGGGYVYMAVSSDYTLTFTATRSSTGATALDVNKALLIGMSVASPNTYTAGAWFAGNSSDANSNLFIDGANVTATYANNSWCGQNGKMTLTVANGKATLTHASHGVVYQNFPVGTSGYVSFYVPSGAGATTLSSVTYTDNTAASTENYKAKIGTSGGTLTSKTVVPGYDTRLGWDGATSLEFAADLSGLGNATFTASLGDVSAKVTPDGGRHLITMYDGDEELALSDGNTNPAFVIGDSIFSFTVRQNGGFSINFNGVTYTAATAATASPYGEISFSVSEGADSAIILDDISLVVDEWERSTVSATTTATGFDSWTTSGSVTVSDGTATISGGYVYFPVGSNYTVTFTATRGTPGVQVLDAGQSFLIGMSVADPATYTSGAWFVASGASQNSNLWIDGANVTSSHTSNSWFGQDGTMTLTVANGVGTLTHATHGVAYSNFSVGASGYVSFYVPSGAGAATVKDISIEYSTEVTDTNIYHTFEDENGLFYYGAPAQTGDSISFASVTPTYGPKKDGYTFAGWTKGGTLVGDTVDNTADATYSPVYTLGEVNYVSASLEGDIGLNFYMNLPTAVTADSTSKVVFTVDGETQEVAVSSGVSTSNGTKFTARVAAQDYDKDVTLSLVTTAGDGTTYSYSVKDYVDAINLADGEEYAAFKPLANAMQAYGAAAQEYFTEKTGVTDNYPDVTKETLTAYRPVLVSGTLAEGVYDLGSTVMMESKTSLRYYFTTDATTAASLVCKIDGETATVKSKVGGSTTYYYVEVEDIAAQNLDQTYDISIGDYTVRISPLGYVYSVLYNASSYSTSLLNAVKAMYLYNVAADAYFNPVSEAPATAASYWDDTSDWNDTFDFVLNVEEGRDVKILQLTDIQIIDSSQQRYDGRLHTWSTEWWKPTKLYDVSFKYTREAVAASNPDLIVLSGDNTYGEFDDSGLMLQALIREIDSYGIPWTLTWGNHDNETYKGTVWMAQQYAASEYCRFTIEDSGITGSGNFTVGVVQGGELTTAVFCVDSNGHTALTANNPASDANYVYTAGQGIQQDQINWIESELAAIKTANGGVAVESIGFTHHPLQGQKEGLVSKYGYAPTATGTQESPLVITDNNLASTVTVQDGDFGTLYYEPTWTDVAGVGGTTDLALHNVSKAGNLVGWFFGHIHWNNASVLYDGVRYTNGLKAGMYDDYEPTDVGGTLITIGQSTSMTAEHLYTAYDTSTRP